MIIIIEREAKDEKNTMVNVTEEGYGGYFEMEIIEITIPLLSKMNRQANRLLMNLQARN